MTHYLIEFRFQGKAKGKIKSLIKNLNKRLKIRSKRAIPHITLVGPIKTRNQRKLIKDFLRICSKAEVAGFEINGFNTFKEKNVLYLDVKPSQKLDEFRWKLSKQLQLYCGLKSQDYERKFYFHSTVARGNKIKNAGSHLNQNIRFEHIIVRATLLKGGKILKEYDFMQRRLLNRREALNRKVYHKTKMLLQDYFNGKYDPDLYVVQGGITVKRKSLLALIIDYFNPPRTFVISDLHLDHTNIIRYCKRPFRNIKEMNSVLVNNWNNTVRRKDTVYFLGDLAFGRGSRNTDYWLKKLKGNIIFIKGNHDKSKNIDFKERITMEHKGHKFMLVHDPQHIPKSWTGWSIHGHHHNNKPEAYGFMNGENKTINVSSEVIGYIPLDLDKLILEI